MTNIKQNNQNILNLKQWSDDFFTIDFNGNLAIKTKSKVISINSIVEKAKTLGATTPLLLRFSHILKAQVESLRSSFHNVAKEIGYKGGYLPVDPIKVNEQADVVKTLLEQNPIGLEAGSKPELMLVTTYAQDGQVIICNGYKDKEFIQLASIAHTLGNQVYVVIEKPYEFDMLKEINKKGMPMPNIGVRVRLSSVGSSHWQNTGGHRSKFGLNSVEVCTLIENLMKDHLLDKLTLLHFHIGSQITNIRDVRFAMKEAGQWYRRLKELGAPIETIDIGGGLGIDYLGTSNRHNFSKNYDHHEYAKAVLQPIKDLCEKYQLDMPNIISESGRAFTAHHAVLVTNILSIEPSTANQPFQGENHFLLNEFENVLNSMTSKNVVESYHEGRAISAEIDQHFIVGDLSLSQKAYGHSLTQKLFKSVRSFLCYSQRQHRDIIDDINQVDVQKVLCNMSVFQSLPDSWAIDQIFPVVPLSHLDKPLTCRTVIHDLTCDSDGQIKSYPLEDGVESSTLFPQLDQKELENLMVGFFLVGAYQETLGDIHNLFGDQDSVIVDIDKNSEVSLSKLHKGDTIDNIFKLVGYNVEELRKDFVVKAEKNKELNQQINVKALTTFFDDVLKNNTYLKDQPFNIE